MDDGGGIGSMTVEELLTAVGAKAPTPGGGAVAGVVGALGVALAQMVVNYSLGKKSLAEHEPVLRGALLRLERASELMLGLADEDAEAYGAMNALLRLPEDDPRRTTELPEAVRASVQVPMSTAAACVEVLRLLQQIAPVSNKQLKSDLAIAAVLADAAVRASRWNVLVNAASIRDEGERMRTSRQLNELAAESARLAEDVDRACR